MNAKWNANAIDAVETLLTALKQHPVVPDKENEVGLFTMEQGIRSSHNETSGWVEKEPTGVITFALRVCVDTNRTFPG